MQRLCWVVLVVILGVGNAQAQFDAAELAEAYKKYDMARNEGRGLSNSADSSTLSVGEGRIIYSYAQMWEATRDVYWLEKIGDHFARIAANANDPDGDGYLSWTTKQYSCAVAYAERLHNASDAQIAPPLQKNTSAKAAALATGHTYLIEFPNRADVLRILDWNTRRPVAENISYQDGIAITQIEPFRFTLSGQPHQGDRFLVRTLAPDEIEFVVHQGMFVFPAAIFIEAVKTRPELKDRFGAEADRFLAFINRHIFEKAERDWLDMGELGGAYRFEPKLTDRFPNRIMPHNQYASLARAWLVLKDLEGAHPLMGQRAEQMVRYLHNHLKLDRERNAYLWHYWDWTEYGKPGHSGYEDTGHASLTMSLAVVAARRGVIFSDEEMARIGNTWIEIMWNHDGQNPAIASSITGEGTHKFSPLMNYWSELSQWKPQVYDLALKAFLALDENRRIPYIPAMLLSMRRAGASLARPSGNPESDLTATRKASNEAIKVPEPGSPVK